MLCCPHSESLMQEFKIYYFVHHIKIFSMSFGDCSSDINVCMSGGFQTGEPNNRETDPSVPKKEDIPTFDEWKKQVMEVEKEKSKCMNY